MPDKIPIGVLISGSGTNLQSIIDHARSGRLDAEVKAVISDNEYAYGLTRAKNAGIPAYAILRRDFETRTDFEGRIASALKKHGVQLVCLAGFMRILSPHFLKEFQGRIMNIHPALLPAFPGLDAQRRAIESGAKTSGCTVHFVDEGTDTGPIILQAEVPVLGTDTEETLTKRILAEEHKLYPKAIQLFAEGRLEIKGGRW
jgi:phosphoribosylglycinamide formyltransferase-1